ncbi:MAG: penicillin-binding transpeptidase domain-containing protein, partial [Actinomycetota bacterium]
MNKGPRKISTRPIVGKRPKRTGRAGGNGRQTSLGLDRIKIRLAVFMLILVAAFVAMFSRLWFLQVLAADEYQVLARENRVRRVDSEPPRGRILDRNGVVLVDNRPSLSVTVDRQVLNDKQIERVLRRLSRLLDVKVKTLEARLNDNTVSPYKPVAVASDVTEDDATEITVFSERYPGVGIEELPVREYPQGKILAQVLGYTGEIPPEDLEGEFAKGAKPVYQPGDIIGRAGIERIYDRWLRGRPRIEKVVVNSIGKVVGQRLAQEQRPGNDLYLSVDVRIQELVEKALEDGILTARSGGYAAPDGGVVVMDPRNGQVIAMASYPTYHPALLADGFSSKDEKALGGRTPDDPQDDALVNRAIAAEQAPGSTFKVVTGGAALANDVIGPYDYLDCPGSRIYPPEGGPGSVTFFNWTSASQGAMGFEEAIETSCNTFFYELGWRMETRWGAALESGDGTERFQKYERLAGFDEPTGIDLPYEQDGV